MDDLYGGASNEELLQALLGGAQSAGQGLRSGISALASNFVPPKEVYNAQGEKVFPTNALERYLSASQDPQMTLASNFVGPGAGGRRMGGPGMGEVIPFPSGTPKFNPMLAKEPPAGGAEVVPFSSRQRIGAPGRSQSGGGPTQQMQGPDPSNPVDRMRGGLEPPPLDPESLGRKFGRGLPGNSQPDPGLSNARPNFEPEPHHPEYAAAKYAVEQKFGLNNPKIQAVNQKLAGEDPQALYDEMANMMKQKYGTMWMDKMEPHEQALHDHIATLNDILRKPPESGTGESQGISGGQDRTWGNGMTTGETVANLGAAGGIGYGTYELMKYLSSQHPPMQQPQNQYPEAEWMP